MILDNFQKEGLIRLPACAACNCVQYNPRAARQTAAAMTSLISSLLAMAGFALVGAITPGPVNVLALRHGSQARRRVALLFVLGASASYTAVVGCMGLGARQAAALAPGLAPVAQWLCAAYLLWLAWRIAGAPVGAMEAQAHGAARPWRAFAQGAAVQALNPKAWLVALSGVGLFVLPHGAAQGSALAWFCAVSLAACLLGVGCWAVAGRMRARWRGTDARQRLFHRGLALLLVASVAAMLA
jgi:threonine/homoserine/homoserine lactone efflux protein